MALDMVTIALCGVLLFAIWMTLPAISEALAQLSYRLWELAIRGDPLARIKRDHAAHARDIQGMDKSIGQCRAHLELTRNTLRSERENFSAEEIREYEEDILAGQKGIAGLEVVRDQMLMDHEIFKRDIMRAEGKLRMSAALGGVAKALAFGKSTGKDSAGARVALQEIESRLANSRAAAQTALNRFNAERLINHGRKDATLIQDSSAGLTLPSNITQKVNA